MGDVVSELDPCHGPSVHVLGVKDGKLCAVGLRDVEHDDHVAIVLLPMLTAVQAKPRDKDGLTHAAMGIPHLSVLSLGVELEEKEGMEG